IGSILLKYPRSGWCFIFPQKGIDTFLGPTEEGSSSTVDSKSLLYPGQVKRGPVLSCSQSCIDVATDALYFGILGDDVYYSTGSFAIIFGTGSGNDLYLGYFISRNHFEGIRDRTRENSGWFAVDQDFYILRTSQGYIPVHIHVEHRNLAQNIRRIPAFD